MPIDREAARLKLKMDYDDNHLQMATGDSRQALEALVTQVLNPGEKILWVGRSRATRSLFVVPILAIGLLAGAMVHKDFTTQWYWYAGVILAGSAYLSYFLMRREKQVILAMTDSRLLMCFAQNRHWWRRLADVKRIESR